MAKYRGWFLNDGCASTRCRPTRRTCSTPSRPFANCRSTRYRFLLDEAQFFIMNFIKGPVCRGQMAVDVIEDQFWVVFVDPTANTEAIRGDVLLRQAERLTLPAEAGSDAGLLGPWLMMAREQRRFLQTKSQVLQQSFDSGTARLDLSLIWDGEGRNRNAALTIFRHFDSASVVQGFVGAPPKTAWVIDYPLFERIYYLLVAGYDVYGNVGHQLNSRLYMDFMRMEGELNFLILLPQRVRESTALFWYRGATGEAREYVYGKNATLDVESAVPLPRRRPAASSTNWGSAGTRAGPALRPPASTMCGCAPSCRHSPPSRCPRAGCRYERARRRTGGRARYFTLLRNTAHANGRIWRARPPNCCPTRTR